MHIDFTKHIKQMKEKDVLHKPFPVTDGYAIFAKNEEGNWVRILFSNTEQLSNYLSGLGYEWGKEGKHEYTNFDCELRLLKVLPELSDVETVAADPQWNADAKPETLHEKENLNESARKVEDVPDLAVELREVDHPIGYDERTHASEDPEGKDYSELWKKVNAYNMPRSLMGFNKFMMGDVVENVNPDCDHYGSQGEIIAVRKIMGMRKPFASESEALNEEELEAGCVFAYKTINEGMNWMKGDVLEKTPDQLELMEGMMRRPF